MFHYCRISRRWIATFCAVVVLAGAGATQAAAATIQQVQSGTAVNSANGIQTITISSIDPTKSFLIFQAASDSNRPAGSTVRGRLASATTIEFERVTNGVAPEPAPINIQWYVATFGSGVKVQRGEVAQSATSVNVPITAVASMGQAFVLWSKTAAAGDNEWSNDDQVLADLTSTSNLQVRCNALNASHIVSWQVVEFTNAADINVQRGSITTMTGMTTSATATLSPAVDTSKTFLLAGWQSSGTGNDLGARMLRARLTNATTVTIDRSSAGSPDDITEIAWQAVELKDGSFVYGGNASVAAGESTALVGLPFFDTRRALAFGSSQSGAGQSTGRTPYVADDILGVGSFTASLGTAFRSAAQAAAGSGALTLTINKPAGTAEFDVMVASIAFRPNTAVITPPAGWTLVRRTDNAATTASSLATYWKTADTTEPASYAWTFDTSTGSNGGILSFVNVDTANPIDVENGATTGNALTHAAPSITTARTDEMIVSMHALSSGATWTPPPGMTEVVDIASETVPNCCGEAMEVNYQLQAAAGATGTLTATASGDADVGVTQTLALRPATSVNALALTRSNTVDTADVGWFVVQFNQGPGFKVGSFTKSTAGAPATQVIAHGLGSVPKAIILWTDGKTNQSFSSHYLFGLGMTDGVTSKSVAAASRDARGTSDSSTRMATKALTIVQWGQSLLAEADLQSWDDTSFTLRWTTNNATAYVIHYIVIGGPDVSAKVLEWTMGTVTGNKSVTGLGFQPDAVIHAHGTYAFTAALPSSVANAGFGLGVMDADGDQWASSLSGMDGQGAADTQRGQQTDAALFSFNNSLAVQKKASWVSMDADGFTMNFTNTTSAAAARVLSLALKGVNVKPGRVLKSTAAAPASQAVTGLGFRPSVVLLTSVQDVTQAAPVGHARLGLGASDGTTAGSTALTDSDLLPTTVVNAIDKTSKAFIKVDAASTINAEADLLSLDADGFTLNWTTNDAVQTEILYLALAPIAATEARVVSLEAARYDRGVLMQWTTGYEIDNLGFHVYRDIGGVKTRVTTALVGGSGLTLGRGVASNDLHHYAFWDLHGAAADTSAVYWLEDVTFDGQSTWHGPVTPRTGGVQPAVAASETLGEGTCRVDGPAGAGAAPCRAAETRLAFEASEHPAADFVKPLPQDPVTLQWDIAAGAAVRIGIRRPGWYAVDQPALLAAGLSPSADPRMLHLYVEGVEQAFRVVGEADGRFDPADRVEFFGTGLDTPSTDTRVYWLVAGTRPGRRLAMSSLMPGATPGTGPFRQTRQVKERSTYFAALRNGDTENWFGQLVSDAGPTAVPLAAPHVVPGAPAVLELALQGVTVADGPGTNHRVAVSVNGRSIDEVAFSGQERAVFRVPLPADVLRDGDNTITLLALDGGSDISLIDVVTVSYAHTHQADADQLLFTAEGQQTLAIGGFSTPAIRIVDLTDPSGAIDVLGTARAEDGLYTVTLVAPGVGTRRLFAFTDFTTASPAVVAANEPTAWHAATSAFDYVVLARRDYFDALRPLADLRARQGYRPAVIDIQDVYDEFSFGEKSPVAIRRFLTRARASWQAAPRFLVLAGDATLDPRDYAGLGDFDLVPTKLLSMSQVALETASDEWFADLNDDGLPGVAVGRLPVRSVAQAQAMVRKILAYETQAPGAWASEVTFVADDNDAANDFEGATRAIEAGLPAGYAAHEVFRGALGAGAGAALASEVSAGRLIVNYLGHGSTRLWGLHGDLLSNDQVASTWRTSTQLPFVLAMNCLSGFFHGIYDEESLAEALLRAPDGGAIAAWASSSLTSSATQRLVSRELFRLLLQDGRLTLGEAAVRAKRVVSQRDLRRSWIFFGDPATRLIGVQPGADASRPLDSLDAVDSVTAAPPDAAAEPDSIRRVRLADVDGDGRADLLVYRPETGEWQAWSAQGSYLRGGRWPAHLDVRAAHLDTDRLADLFLYAPETGGWSALVSDGQAFASTSGTGLPGAYLQLADVDGDGRDDVFLYQYTTGAWSLGLNDGQGGFTVTTGQWTPGLTVRLADFTGVGRAGFFTYDRTTGRWQVLDQADGTAARAGRTSRGWEVAVTRLDADNRADLLMHDPATGRWETWVNPTRGTFAIRRTGIWPAGRIAQVADVAGEGLDVAFLYRPETGEWAFAPLTDAGAPAAAGIGPRGADLALGDIDGDGLTEFYLYQRSTGDVLLVDAEAGARIVVGGAAWPTGWALSGAQPVEPTTLARLEATGPWPIAPPRLYVIDRRDAEAALQAVGLPQVVARRPSIGRYDGNYAVGSTTAALAATSAVATVPDPSAASMQPGASAPQATVSDAPAPVPAAGSPSTAAAASPTAASTSSPAVALAPSAGEPSVARTFGMPAYGASVVLSRQREASAALLEASTADPLNLEPQPDASLPMTTATAAATDLTASSALLHGVAEHAADGSRAGFLWGTDARMLISTDLEPLAAIDGTFSGMLKDLDADTVYYFRAVVETPESGRLLGEVMQFRTLPAPPASGR